MHKKTGFQGEKSKISLPENLSFAERSEVLNIKQGKSNLIGQTRQHKK